MASPASEVLHSTNWASCILQMQHIHPDTLIYMDAEHPELTLSRGQYVSLVKRTAAGLHQLGLQSGDCVALLSRNDIRYWTFGDGVIAAGGIFAPMCPHSPAEETALQLRAVQAKWVFVQDEFLDITLQAASSAEIPSDHVLIFDSETAPTGSHEHQSLTRLLQEDENAVDSSQRTFGLSGEQTCLRLMTSGSTGSPKVAEISHRALIARQGGILALGQIQDTEQNRLLQMIDMYHVSGHSVHCVAISGTHTVIVTNHADAASVIDNISRFKISDTIFFPRLIEDILAFVQEGQRSPDALKTLQTVFCGGSAVRPDAIRHWSTMFHPGAALMQGYGSTEAGPLTVPCRDIDPEFSGNISPRAEIMIADPTNFSDVGQGTEGEVCCRGPMLFSGYLGNDEATQASYFKNKTGQWFRTGDRGRISSEGNLLALTGRYKEVFKVVQDEVSPEEVEARLMTHPAVVDAAVAAVPGRRNQGDFEPGAVVVSRDPRLTGQDLVQHVARASAAHKAPTGGVVFVDAVPRNASGKVLRFRAREMLEADPARAFLDRPA